MHVRQLLIDALLSKYKSQVDDATAKIVIYLHNTVAIGEHPQFTEELDKLINIVSTAEENIKTIPDALSKVNQMRGVSYNKIGEEKVRIGMVADEVEKIVPELVITGGERSKFDEDGIDNMKSLKYTNMVGVLVEAVKELSSQVTDLKKEIEDLKG